MRGLTVVFSRFIPNTVGAEFCIDWSILVRSARHVRARNEFYSVHFVDRAFDRRRDARPLHNETGMGLVRIAVLFTALLATTTVVQAAPRVSECSYDIHGVRVSDIRYDGYFQNRVEMSEVGDGRFRGVVPLFAGHALIVDAVLKDRRIALKSSIRTEFHVALSMSGTSALPAVRSSHAYRMRARRALPDGSGFVFFDRADVTCTVVP